MYQFLTAPTPFFRTFFEKVQEFTQMDQDQNDLKELHANRLFDDGPDPNLSYNNIYHNNLFKKRKTKGNDDFLDEQYERMKRAIVRRYQPRYEHNTISLKNKSEKDYFNDRLTETLFRICSVSSERTVSKYKKDNQDARKEIKKSAEQSNLPTYVLYEYKKENYK